MENKNNNAVEKAEKIAKNNKHSKKNTDKSVKNSKSKSQNKKKVLSEKQQKRQALRQEKDKQRAEKKAERERIMAEKRVELARIKAHKKAEKEKARATALREKNRRKAEHLAKKQQLKAERQERKQLLKSESKKQRHERIAREKQARREERAKIREEKRLKREHKSKEKRERRKSRKGVGGWIAAVISLGVATLVLASVLTFTFLMPTTTDNMLEVAYQKSFVSTVEQVDNIDLNLSKVLATKDTGAMQKYLVDIAINSELAENEINQLPLHDESKHYTTKIVNQVGDFAKYLNNKLINGEQLSQEDMQGLRELYKANAMLKDSLKKITSDMPNDYSFASLLEGDEKDLIISNLTELQNLSVQFPELIYDGPFSDGQASRQLKGLNGAEIDKDTAMKTFTEIFSNYNLTDVAEVGEVLSGEISAYNIQGRIDEDILYAQISKKGGKLLMFAYSGSCESVKYSEDEAVESAQEFLSTNKLENMKPVWINLANNVYTINFAGTENGIIIYPDLVKVRVCAQTKMVIGLEAKSYYTNHTERTISKPSISVSKAAEKVSDNIELHSKRLVLVPIGNSKEALCYEFMGELDGATYYVYIDATNGRQVEMFKVVDGTEGKLMM